jgi:hypothetical protein
MIVYDVATTAVRFAAFGLVALILLVLALHAYAHWTVRKIATEPIRDIRPPRRSRD